MMMGFGGFGFLFMLIFFMVIIGLAVWLVSALFPRGIQGEYPPRSPASQRGEETALDILKKRYARGEITKAEYESMRQDLLST